MASQNLRNYNFPLYGEIVELPVLAKTFHKVGMNSDVCSASPEVTAAFLHSLTR
jgi:hypothetical protein